LAVGAWNDTSTKDAALNQPRMRGVRSGFRRCRVQMTVAPGAQSWGNRRTVFSILSGGTFPKTPHTRTRSAGTAPSYASVLNRPEFDGGSLVWFSSHVGLRPVTVVGLELGRRLVAVS